MPKPPTCPPDLTRLLGTYRATCGSAYRAFWQHGALWLARTRPGETTEERAYPYTPGDLRRQIDWQSFARIPDAQ